MSGLSGKRTTLNARMAHPRGNPPRLWVARLHPGGMSLRPCLLAAALLGGATGSTGGGYSTAQDLLRFLQALRAGQVPEAPPAGIGVAGGAPGINAILEGELPGGYDLVVMANLDPPAAMRVGQLVRGWL